MTSACHPSCGPWIYEVRARAEAEKARHAIATELKVGSPEPDILAFFARHKWSVTYDDIFHQFVSDMYRSPDDVFTVMVHIDVNEKKEFARYEVSVEVTYL